MNSRSVIIKSGIWYTISNYLIKGLDFITIPIFTRLLSVDEFGEYNNFLSCLQLIYVIGSICVDASFISARFDFQKDLKNYTKTALLCSNISTLLIGAVFALFSNGIKKVFGVDEMMLIFVFLYCFFRPSLDVFQQIERYDYKYKACVLTSAITSIASVTTSLILVLIFRDKLHARIIGTYIPLIIGSAAFYFNYMKSSLDIKYAKYVYKICLPYIPHSLAITVLASTDRIMINYYRSAKEVAFYSIAYTCSIALSVFSNSLNSSFVPWLANCINSKDVILVRETAQRYLLVFFVPLVFAAILSPEVLLVLGGNQYIEAKYVMPPVLISCFIQYAYSMLVDVEQIAKKTGGMAIASVMAASVNLVLNFVFVPQYGYIAAAYTTLVSYMVLFLLHYFLIKKIGYNHIYDTKKMIATIALLSMVIGGIGLLYENPAIRICIFIICIVAFAAFLAKNFNNIKEWYRKDENV